jgi:hypothetical protein
MPALRDAQTDERQEGSHPPRGENMKKYAIIPCHSGQAMIRVPEDWLDDPVQFASSHGDALIRFTKNNLAFRVFLISGRAHVERVCPEMVEWGEFCAPFQSWNDVDIISASRETLDLY